MPRKKNSKAKTKKSEQLNYSRLSEIFQCNVIDCNIINGDSILIYRKQSGDTLNCCRVHPSINSSLISDIKKAIGGAVAKVLGGCLPSCWIAIWNDLDGLYIKNYAPSLEDLIKEIDVRKADTANMHESMQKFITVGENGGLDDDIPF